MAVEPQARPPGGSTQTVAVVRLAASEASTTVPSGKTAPEPLVPPMPPTLYAASSGWGLPTVMLALAEAKALAHPKAETTTRIVARAIVLLAGVKFLSHSQTHVKARARRDTTPPPTVVALRRL